MQILQHKMTLFDSLDDFLVRYVASFIPLSLRMPLRSTCARMRALCPASANARANEILVYGARIGNVELCTFARERGANAYNDMLAEATTSGNRELCILAHQWGATDFDNMLKIAAQTGNRELCVLAHDWGATYMYGMLIHAASYGNRELCMLALEWNEYVGNECCNYENIFISAARHGKRELCEFACQKSLAVKEIFNYEIILYVSASGGLRDICELARNQCITDGIRIDYYQFLACAASGGHCDMCKLAREWILANNCDPVSLRAYLANAMLVTNRKQHYEAHEFLLKWFISLGPLLGNSTAPDCIMQYATERDAETITLTCEYHVTPWNDLFHFAQFGRLDLCIKAREMGATGYDIMLHSAACGNQRELCILARDWMLASGRIPDVDRMLLVATRYNYRDLCILAREWGAARSHDMMRIIVEDDIRDLVHLAREWMGDDLRTFELTNLLYIAFQNNNIWMCKLLRKWGAGWDDIALYHAIGSNDLCICKLVREWAQADGRPLDPNTVLMKATIQNRFRVCELAREWGATNYNEMLELATRHSLPSLCKLAVQWGATNINSALCIAAGHHNLSLCKYLCDLGATDFAGILRLSDIVEEIQDWAREKMQ